MFSLLKEYTKGKARSDEVVDKNIIEPIELVEKEKVVDDSKSDRSMNGDSTRWGEYEDALTVMHRSRPIGRKAHLLEGKQISSVGHLEEKHVTWARFEKKLNKNTTIQADDFHSDAFIKSAQKVKFLIKVATFQCVETMLGINPDGVRIEATTSPRCLTVSQ
ncbi:hypothetical protein Tco_1003470 [Tanacetum coccineum]|uniref:Uncharacterized protein n=1 Tax=Tanacetum coccineum TaxID=301880 RepID=A0ABQ5FB30_9ASTR